MLNILLVEHRHQQRSEIHSSLVKAGNSVVLADTPDKVEMALTHRRYKLVIFDMNSAGMGLLKTVIAEKYEAKLLLLSTRDQFAECLQGFNLGADDYMEILGTLPFQILGTLPFRKIEDANLPDPYNSIRHPSR